MGFRKNKKSLFCVKLPKFFIKSLFFSYWLQNGVSIFATFSVFLYGCGLCRFCNWLTYLGIMLPWRNRDPRKFIFFGSHVILLVVLNCCSFYCFLVAFLVAYLDQSIFTIQKFLEFIIFVKFSEIFVFRKIQ